MLLFLAPPLTEVKILKLLVDDKTKRYLNSLGICQGNKISLLSKSSKDLIIKVFDTTLALNKDIALKIIVG